MSPFEDVSSRLTARVAALPLRAQVALFASGAEVLAPRYQVWVTGTGGAAPDEGDLLGRAIALARRFAAGDESATSPELLQQVEESTPGDPTDVEWFAAAQDCWICADTALRAAQHEFEAEDSVWYLLEPVFQRTSERLFGYSDVGSELQDRFEAQALEDPALRAAVTAIDSAVDLLGTTEVDEAVLTRVSASLAPIAP